MLVLFATMLAGKVPNVAGHLMVACIISVPASIVFARILIPETEAPTSGRIAIEQGAHGALDALTQGTRQGLELFLNILAMLLVFVALVHLVDALLSLLPMVGGSVLSLGRVFGWLASPIAWLIGIPWSEAATVGALLGTKTTLNEVLAYVQLYELPAGALSDRSLIYKVVRG